MPSAPVQSLLAVRRSNVSPRRASHVSLCPDAKVVQLALRVPNLDDGATCVLQFFYLSGSMMDHGKPKTVTPDIFQFDFTDQRQMSPEPSRNGLSPDIEISSTLVEEIEPTPPSGEGLRLVTLRMFMIGIELIVCRRTLVERQINVGSRISDFFSDAQAY